MLRILTVLWENQGAQGTTGTAQNGQKRAETDGIINIYHCSEGQRGPVCAEVSTNLC